MEAYIFVAFYNFSIFSSVKNNAKNGLKCFMFFNLLCLKDIFTQKQSTVIFGLRAFTSLTEEQFNHVIQSSYGCSESEAQRSIILCSYKKWRQRQGSSGTLHLPNRDVRPSEFQLMCGLLDKCYHYLTNILSIYYQNQGNISLLSIWQNSENSDPHLITSWSAFDRSTCFGIIRKRQKTWPCLSSCEAR